MGYSLIQPNILEKKRCTEINTDTYEFKSYAIVYKESVHLPFDETDILSISNCDIDEIDIYTIYGNVGNSHLQYKTYNISPEIEIVGTLKLEGYSKKEAYKYLSSGYAPEKVKFLKVMYRKISNDI